MLRLTGGGRRALPGPVPVLWRQQSLHHSQAIVVRPGHSLPDSISNLLGYVSDSGGFLSVHK